MLSLEIGLRKSRIFSTFLEMLTAKANQNSLCRKVILSRPPKLFYKCSLKYNIQCTRTSRYLKERHYLRNPAETDPCRLCMLGLLNSNCKITILRDFKKKKPSQKKNATKYFQVIYLRKSQKGCAELKNLTAKKQTNKHIKHNKQKIFNELRQQLNYN